MNDPIKIIHKYKNNNKRIQYHINIFIGDVQSEYCMKILNKIKDMDLYKTWTSLQPKEYDTLVSIYGDHWYEKFFNSYHIVNTIENLQKNKIRSNELKNIYGKDWIKTHITNFRQRLNEVTFKYEYMYKTAMEHRYMKTALVNQKNTLAEDILDYTTLVIASAVDIISPTNDMSRINAEPMSCKWLDETDILEDEIEEIESSDLDDIDSEIDSDIDSDINTDSDFDTESDDEIIEIDDPTVMKLNSTDQQTGGEDPVDPDVDSFAELEYDQLELDANNSFDDMVEQDLADIDTLFDDLDNVDKNIKLTTREIKDAISNESYEKSQKKISDFDQSKDTSIFDENLKDVYVKNYITSQYIYKDDNIKTINRKICCSIKNNKKFGDNAYIIPSYQYLWSEYYFKGSIEKIMIGQKWIIKNDILKLDVEPNTNLNVYEDLRGNLKTLRDNIKRHGKIKREEDDNNILLDYNTYFTMNELYMIDVYNEFGLNYNPNFEELKNIMDVYLKIYFPKIIPDKIKNILDTLNTSLSESKKMVEYNNNIKIFESANNDLILENEIMRDIELIRKNKKQEYTKLFKENYVNQSVIRAYLMEKGEKIDLYRIFNNFVLEPDYPFVQYQPLDGNPKWRYHKEYLLQNERKEVIAKWFENSPYGISFKVRMKEKKGYKYIAINLTSAGKIDYKIQWREKDYSTIDDIKKTYHDIRKLVNKINTENERYGIKLHVPEDTDFKYAFINTIQRFELPEDYNINHNDLSNFARYFYPYIALVIEPRKRQSIIKKNTDDQKSKFGTYLKYKRISKYENKIKIEHRILFFIRNYEYDDQSLSTEISKEFNITEEQAFEEIINTRKKYPNVKRSRRILKKLENIPKYKTPGIDINIQGKTRDNYKIRIAGARDNDQLMHIIDFMNILIYLYLETYLYKIPERQMLKEKLKRLTKIARRTGKVDQFIKHDTPNKNIKNMTILDSNRLSNNKNDEFAQWSRECQNYGQDNLRRPQQFLSVDMLLSAGYVWKEKLDGKEFGHYEKLVQLFDKKKNKSKNIKLRAIQLPLDDTGENFIYYTCNPEENGRHMYVGFLGKNQNGETRPCCFIKDHLYSKNPDKRNFYLKSLGLLEDNVDNNKITGDQLYILQDSNKLQEGRISYLPRHLELFMNIIPGNDKKIDNHYLAKSNTGYFFKYGSKQDDQKYLNAIATALDTTSDNIRKKMISALQQDNNLSIFTSLNNGMIRTQFQTIDAYIKYIEISENLDNQYINDLLSIPGVIYKHGLNLVIFQKKTRIVRKNLEKEKLKENWYIVCNNTENMNNWMDDKRQNIIMVHENRFYYPIVKVRKTNIDSKDIDIFKTFKWEDNDSNIISHIYKWYDLSCRHQYNIMVNDPANNMSNAKETYSILNSLSDSKWHVKGQIIDSVFKCKYLVINAGYLIPVLLSGSIFNLKILKTCKLYLKDYDTTHKTLKELYKITAGRLNLNPIGIYYSNKTAKMYTVSAIMTNTYYMVPIIEKKLTSEYIKNNSILIEKKPDTDALDELIISGNTMPIVDDRVYYIAKHNYEVESYQLFRYHLSWYLNNIPQGLEYKSELQSIISNTKISKKLRKFEIKKLLYKMIDNKLYDTYVELLKNKKLLVQTGGITNPQQPVQFNTNSMTIAADDNAYKYFETNSKSHKNLDLANNQILPKKILKINNGEIKYTDYVIKNNRDLCYAIPNKNECNKSMNCMWNVSDDTCIMKISQDLVIEYINRVAEEFVQNEMKCYEIMRRDNYFVSDIVNYNIFTERPGEKIIITSNTNIEKILSDIFGKNNIPKIGRRRNKIDLNRDFDEFNAKNPLRTIGMWYVQNILENNNSIFRAFANVYYWLNHPYSEKNLRNIGYYSTQQTNLANIYKSQVVDWLIMHSNSKITVENSSNTNNLEKTTTTTNDKIMKQIKPFLRLANMSSFINKLSMDIETNTNCIIECMVLAIINNLSICIYDENFNIVYAFDTSGIVHNYKTSKIEFDTSMFKKKLPNVNIRFPNIYKNAYPDIIEALYS